MTGDCHVQFGERLAGKFRRPTHLDITLDYKAFGESIRGDESRTEIDKLNDRLKGFVLEHTRDKIKPYFEKVLSELSSKRKGKVELDETGEKLYVYYPSVLGEDSKRYVPTSVLLEFGGQKYKRAQ